MAEELSAGSKRRLEFLNNEIKYHENHLNELERDLKERMDRIELCKILIAKREEEIKLVLGEEDAGRLRAEE